MARRGPRGQSTKRAGGETSCVWVGGRLSPPFFIEDRDEPYRAQLALWLEEPSGLVVGQDVFAPENAEGVVGRVLQQALERPLAGRRRRPDAIRVAEPALAAEVRAAIGDAIPVSVAPTPELDALLAHMLDSMPEREEAESYLEGGRISPEAVRELFDAAETLHRVAPWRVATGEHVLRMDIPALGVEGACVSIIGNLGESLGLIVFPSLAGYEAFLRASDTAPRARGRIDMGTDWLALDFQRGADLSAALRREIASHGWRVAGADAYPRVTRYDRDATARPLVERDLEIAAACALALTTCFVKHERLFAAEDPEPICESYFDEDDFEVRVTLPYEAFPLFEVERPVGLPAARETGGARKVSRNAPCPCGSGRKYKKCCLSRDEEQRGASRGPHPLRELDIRLVGALSALASRRHGPTWLDASDTFEDGAQALQLAVPWSLYHRRIDGATVLDRYLEERHQRLSSAERAWLGAQRDAWLSIWEVTGVDPGVGLELRDLLSGEARVVSEALASSTLVRRDAVLARVVDGEGVSLLCGVHPRSLPPVEAADVVRRARARLRRKGAVPPERLRDEGVGRALIRSWEEAVALRDARSRAPAALQNTDGDPLLLTTDHFGIAPGARPAVEAGLAALPDVESPAPGEDAAVYVFLRAGNRMHDSWNDTVVGHVSISGQELRAATNSRERADALRARLEAACGERIRHRAREHADPLSERAPRSRREHGTQPLPPEAEQLVLEFQQRHYAEWLDQPIPALGGRTPREAARTAQGRSAVDLLLKDLENRTERSKGSGAPFDFSALRRELRLDDGGNDGNEGGA